MNIINKKIEKIKKIYNILINRYNNIYNNNSILKKIINKVLNYIKYMENEKNSLYIKENISNIINYINDIEIFFFIKNEHININECYMYIKSIAGGKDSNDWSNILFNSYIKYIKKKNMNYEVIYKSLDIHNKIKNIVIKIHGNFSYGLLYNEIGIHKLIRKSPFSSYKKQTSFSSVFVYPYIINKNIIKNNYIKEKINIKNLKIKFSKSSGPGGQNVNKRNSSVKITHIPTNISVNCQDNRSQHINKYKALKNINIKINNYNFNNINDLNNKINKIKLNLNNNIRIYYLNNSIIKDTRINYKYNINFFLNGFLDELIKKKLEFDIKNE